MNINKELDNVFFQDMLSTYYLAGMWMFIRTSNPGKRNPYHNTEHMKQVAILAIRLLHGDREFLTWSPNKRYMYTVACLMACLWHDYAHSGGMSTDEENVDTAIRHFEEWWYGNILQNLQLSLNSRQSPEQFKCYVVKLIRCTQYPFIHSPADLVSKCIRDADLLYTFSSDTGDIIHGLYKELKHKLPCRMQLSDFFSEQIKFHKGAVLFTDLGRQIHAALKPAILKEQTAWLMKHYNPGNPS